MCQTEVGHFGVKHDKMGHRHCRSREQRNRNNNRRGWGQKSQKGASTHKSEFAAVLTVNPPVAGAEVFAENIMEGSKQRYMEISG